MLPDSSSSCILSPNTMDDLLAGLSTPHASSFHFAPSFSLPSLSTLTRTTTSSQQDAPSRSSLPRSQTMATGLGFLLPSNPPPTPPSASESLDRRQVSSSSDASSISSLYSSETTDPSSSSSSDGDARTVVPPSANSPSGTFMDSPHVPLAPLSFIPPCSSNRSSPYLRRVSSPAALHLLPPSARRSSKPSLDAMLNGENWQTVYAEGLSSDEEESPRRYGIDAPRRSSFSSPNPAVAPPKSGMTPSFLSLSSLRRPSRADFLAATGNPDVPPSAFGRRSSSGLGGGSREGGQQRVASSESLMERERIRRLGGLGLLNRRESEVLQVERTERHTYESVEGEQAEDSYWSPSTVDSSSPFTSSASSAAFSPAPSADPASSPSADSPESSSDPSRLAVDALPISLSSFTFSFEHTLSSPLLDLPPSSPTEGSLRLSNSNRPTASGSAGWKVTSAFSDESDDDFKLEDEQLREALVVAQARDEVKAPAVPAEEEDISWIGASINYSFTPPLPSSNAFQPATRDDEISPMTVVAPSLPSQPGLKKKISFAALPTYCSPPTSFSTASSSSTVPTLTSTSTALTSAPALTPNPTPTPRLHKARSVPALSIVTTLPKPSLPPSMSHTTFNPRSAAQPFDRLAAFLSPNPLKTRPSPSPLAGTVARPTSAPVLNRRLSSFNGSRTVAWGAQATSPGAILAPASKEAEVAPTPPSSLPPSTSTASRSAESRASSRQSIVPNPLPRPSSTKPKPHDKITRRSTSFTTLASPLPFENVFLARAQDALHSKKVRKSASRQSLSSAAAAAAEVPKPAVQKEDSKDEDTPPPVPPKDPHHLPSPKPKHVSAPTLPRTNPILSPSAASLSTIRPIILPPSAHSSSVPSPETPASPPLRKACNCEAKLQPLAPPLALLAPTREREHVRFSLPSHPAAPSPLSKTQTQTQSQRKEEDWEVVEVVSVEKGEPKKKSGFKAIFGGGGGKKKAEATPEV